MNKSRTYAPYYALPNDSLELDKIFSTLFVFNCTAYAYTIRFNASAMAALEVAVAMAVVLLVVYRYREEVIRKLSMTTVINESARHWIYFNSNKKHC